MDRQKVDFDAYITDGRYHEWTDDITCPHCGCKFSWTFMSEYGAVWPAGDEVICPECDEEVEEY